MPLLHLRSRKLGMQALDSLTVLLESAPQ